MSPVVDGDSGCSGLPLVSETPVIAEPPPAAVVGAEKAFGSRSGGDCGSTPPAVAEHTPPASIAASSEAVESRSRGGCGSTPPIVAGPTSGPPLVLDTPGIAEPPPAALVTS